MRAGVVPCDDSGMATKSRPVLSKDEITGVVIATAILVPIAFALRWWVKSTEATATTSTNNVQRAA